MEPLGTELSPQHPMAVAATWDAFRQSRRRLSGRVFVELFSLRSEIPPEAALFVITGFLGGLTTFSTFSAEAVTLLARGQYFWALSHITSHLAGSLVMTVLGIATCRRLWP